MSSDPFYNCDTEFLKLLTRRSDIDLTLLSLELARDGCPELEFGETLSWIEERSSELAGPIASSKNERDALRLLGECLSEKYEIFGSEAAFESIDSYYLNRSIKSGRGIPLTLSILYMAVGEQLGLDLRGVSTPLHFLTRYESIDGPLFVDAFSRGRIFEYDECLEWVAKISKQSTTDVELLLEPAHPRAIVIRMLNNLKNLHARQDDWAAAWIVQHRLTALQPAAYRERRDLALISLHADRPGHAIDLFESCLRTCPDDEKNVLEQHLDEARGQLARWN